MVEGRREARTVEAIRAAFVERDAGNLCDYNFLVSLRGWHATNDYGGEGTDLMPTLPP